MESLTPQSLRNYLEDYFNSHNVYLWSADANREEQVVLRLLKLFEWANTVKASLYMFLCMSARNVMSSRKHNTSDAGFLSDTPWLNRACLSAALGFPPADVPLPTVAKSVTTFCLVCL